MQRHKTTSSTFENEELSLCETITRMTEEKDEATIRQSLQEANLKNGFGKKAKNAEGQTPLIAAVLTKNNKVVKALKELVEWDLDKLDYTFKDKTDNTAYDYAFAQGDVECVHLLKSEDITNDHFLALNKYTDLDKAAALLRAMWHRVKERRDPIEVVKKAAHEAAKNKPKLALVYLNLIDSYRYYSEDDDIKPFFKAAVSIPEPDYDLVSGIFQLYDGESLGLSEWKDPTSILTQALEKGDAALILKIHKAKPSCLDFANLSLINSFLRAHADFQHRKKVIKLLPFTAALRKAAESQPPKTQDVLDFVEIETKEVPDPEIAEPLSVAVKYAVDVITGEKPDAFHPPRLSYSKERLQAAQTATKAVPETKKSDDLEQAIAADDLVAVETWLKTHTLLFAGKKLGEALFTTLKQNKPHAYLIADLLLAQKQIDTDLVDKEQHSALGYAAGLGFSGIVATLLKKITLPPNPKTVKQLEDAIQLAIQGNQEATAKKLTNYCMQHAFTVLEHFFYKPGTPINKIRIEILSDLADTIRAKRIGFNPQDLTNQAANACLEGEPEVLACYLKAAWLLSESEEEKKLFWNAIPTIVKSLPFNSKTYELYRTILYYADNYSIEESKVPVADLIREAEKRKDVTMLFLLADRLASPRNFSLYDHPRFLAQVFKRVDKDTFCKWEAFKFGHLIKSAGKVSIELLLEIVSGICLLKVFPEIQKDIKTHILKYRNENPDQVKDSSQFSEIEKLVGIHAEIEEIASTVGKDLQETRRSLAQSREALLQSVRDTLSKGQEILTKLQRGTELEAKNAAWARLFAEASQLKISLEHNSIIIAVILSKRELQESLGQFQSLFAKVSAQLAKPATAGVSSGGMFGGGESKHEDNVLTQAPQPQEPHTP